MNKSSTTETENPQVSLKSYLEIETPPSVRSEDYPMGSDVSPNNNLGGFPFGYPVTYTTIPDPKISEEEKLIPINFLGSERLLLKMPIAAVTKHFPEDKNWVVDSPELNVYGVGRDEYEALNDVKSAFEESYFNLKQDKDKLGPRLEKEWGFFNQIIEEK